MNNRKLFGLFSLIVTVGVLVGSSSSAASKPDSCNQLFSQKSRTESASADHKTTDIIHLKQTVSYSRYVNFEFDHKQMLELNGTSGYDSKLTELLFRELIQNSVDATREQKLNHSTKSKAGLSSVISNIKSIFGTDATKVPYSPQVNVFVDSVKNWIAVEDNGIGMNTDTIAKAFLTLGGSKKGESASGGFGIAKGALISGSKRIFVSTIHDGEKHQFVINCQQLISDPGTKIKIDTYKAKGQPNGTIVAIELLDNSTQLPRSEDKTGLYNLPYLVEDVPVNFAHTNLANKFEDIPAEIANYKASPLAELRPFFKKTDTQGQNFVKETMYFEKWGMVEITINTKKAKVPKHHILSNGIYQFTSNSFIDDNYALLPHHILINFKPTIKANNPFYPFNNTRDDIRPSIKDDFKTIIIRVKAHVAKIQLDFINKHLEGLVPLGKVSIQELYERVKNEKSIPKLYFDDEFQSSDTKDINIANYENIITADQPVLNNRTSLDLNMEPVEFRQDSLLLFSKLTGVLQHIQKHLIELSMSSSNLEFIALGTQLKKYQVGIIIDKNLHGVRYGGKFNAVLINPLTLELGTDGHRIIENIYTTIVHELIHVTRSGHSEWFSILRDDIAALMATEGYNAIMKEVIAEILTEHRQTFSALRRKFHDRSVVNVHDIDPLL